MTIPPRTPVVVGVGTVLQREDDPARALEPCALMVEALNRALKGIPEERTRYHVCSGSWNGPHVYDVELKNNFPDRLICFGMFGLVTEEVMIIFSASIPSCVCFLCIGIFAMNILFTFIPSVNITSHFSSDRQ